MQIPPKRVMRDFATNILLFLFFVFACLFVFWFVFGEENLKSNLKIYIYIFFFLMEVHRPGIEFKLQLQPTMQLWQCQIL